LYDLGMRRTGISLAIAFALITVGCGGGGGGGIPDPGFVEVRVDWPARGRYVPPYANSIVATLTAGSIQYQATLNRSGDQSYQGGVQFPSAIPVGTHALAVEAFTGTNGSGTKVAVGARQVVVQSNQTAIVAVSGDLQTTIDHLVIDGQPIAVTTGNQLQVNGHAEDAGNVLILLPATAFSWSIAQGSNVGSISAGGLFTGLAAGTATVRLAEEGAQKETTAQIAVTDPPEWFVIHRTARFVVEPYLLWRMNVDGSGLVQLTVDVGQVGDRHPARSPDGTKIAFARMPQGSTGRGNIWVMNNDGSGLVQLTTGGQDDDPSWSPDGLQIAFFRGDPEQIWKMNADGSGQAQLTSTSYNIQPTWSPDGQKIAFQGNPVSQGDDIYVMNSDGSNVQRLTTAAGQDGYPCWTRAGRIIFQSEGRRGLYIMDADGSNQVELVPFGSWDYMYQAAVTFDGSKFACEVDIGSGNREIFLFNIDGSGATNVSDSASTADFHPSFRGSP
jgi:TolB protein